MKKLFTSLLFAVFAFTVFGQSFTTIESEVSGMEGLRPLAISPDGKYVTGNVLANDVLTDLKSHHAFVWTLESGIEEWDAVNVNEIGHGSLVRDINNRGLVIGATPDLNIMVPL